MTKKMQHALTMLANHGITYTGDPNRYGVVTSDATHLSSGQPWIHYRTAFALQRAGKVIVTGEGEETEVILEARP